MRAPTVDDINPALPIRTLNYGNYGMFLMMGDAGFISAAVYTRAPMHFAEGLRVFVGFRV